MKQSPIVFLLILISMVIVSAFINPGNDSAFSGERDGPFSLPSRPPEDRHFDNFQSAFVSQDIKQVGTDRAMLKDIITKSEVMSQRLAASILILKQEGENVGKMESLLEEYTMLVGNARMYLEMSDTLADTSNANSLQNTSLACQTEEECLEKSRDSISKASQTLKSIFTELSPYLAPHEKISQNVTLIARGNGTVVLFGDLDVRLSLSDGRISYLDFNKDLSVSMENDAIPQVSLTRANQEMISYDNITGNVSLSGSGFMVEVVGEDISLAATGTGRSELFGNGIYYLQEGNTTGKKQIWKPPIFENN